MPGSRNSVAAVLAAVCLTLYCSPAETQELWYNLDVYLGGGARSIIDQSGASTFAYRSRVGVTLCGFRDHWTFGVVASTYDFLEWSLGAQAEYLHIQTGLSSYLGFFADFQGGLGSVIGVGWSVFVVETTMKFAHTFDLGIVGLVRIPFSMITMAIDGRVGRRIENSSL